MRFTAPSSLNGKFQKTGLAGSSFQSNRELLFPKNSSIDVHGSEKFIFLLENCNRQNDEYRLRLSLMRSRLFVRLAKVDEVQGISPMCISDTETAFAMAVHKSQGFEIGYTVFVWPDQGCHLMDYELAYRGITRARQALTLVSPQRAMRASALESMAKSASGLRLRSNT
jgi:hypothetical protein